MKKTPDNAGLATVLLTGLGMMSFGILFIWIPIFGIVLLIVGFSMLLASILAILTKLSNKMVK